jgi:signal transduction histidine kinase
MGRLFDPFYTTKSGGMGIGLSVSRSIIESHRGRLWAVPNDGPGTSFLFSVPQKADGRAGNPDLAINRASAVADGEHPTPNR